MYHIKEDKRTQITTKLISDALLDLILNNQWDKLTVTALVNHAQVGRATFYRSFDAIEDVLQYQVDATMDLMFQSIYDDLIKRAYFYELDLYTLFFRFWNQHDSLIEALIISDQKSLFNISFKTLFFERLSFVQKTLDIKDAHWTYFVTLRTSIFSNGLFEWVQLGKKESPEEISKILLLAFSELHKTKLSLHQ